MAKRGVLALGMLLSPAFLSAQIISGPPPTAAECTAMIGALNPGNPDGEAWHRVGECGASGVSALGSALWAARSSTDTLYLQSLLEAASRVKHPTIFGTSREIVTADSSSNDARVMGLLLLLTQYDPGYSRPLGESWATTMSVPVGSWCRLIHMTDSFQVQEGALPADYLARIASTTEAAMFGNYSAVVKDLASCIRTTIAHEYPERVPTSAITLTYVCDNKFRVSNAGVFSIDVTYSVNNTTETGDLVVSPGGHTEFDTEMSGLVLLTYMGQVIRERANGGVPCS